MDLSYVFVALAWATALVSLITLGVAHPKRWELTRKLARVTTYCAGTLMVLLPFHVVFTFSAIANADASSKATHLARGISEAMNCGVLGAPGLLIGPICWWLAARRWKPTVQPA